MTSPRTGLIDFGLMKSAALELGEYNITVNALIPGLVDTPLTRYETRLRNSVGEEGQQIQDPTPQQTWDIRAATVPLKVGWLQAMVTGAEYEVTGGDSANDI